MVVTMNKRALMNHDKASTVSERRTKLCRVTRRFMTAGRKQPGYKLARLLRHKGKDTEAAQTLKAGPISNLWEPHSTVGNAGGRGLKRTRLISTWRTSRARPGTVVTGYWPGNRYGVAVVKR